MVHYYASFIFVKLMNDETMWRYVVSGRIDRKFLLDFLCLALENEAIHDRDAFKEAFLMSRFYAVKTYNYYGHVRLTLSFIRWMMDSTIFIV